MGAYQRTMQRFGHTAVFAAVMKRILPPIDRAVSRVSRGRFTFGQTVLPTFVLVHRGAKSGREYHTPLSFLRTSDGFALAASNWGQAHHPGWSFNLDADPDAAVIVEGETLHVRARRATPDERAELWPRFVAMWPAYDTYKARAGSRDIKVFVLERR